MISLFLSRHAYELAKLLVAGEWVSRDYLVLSAGKFYPPELASRQKNHGRLIGVEAGQHKRVSDILGDWTLRGRLEKRLVGVSVSYRVAPGLLSAFRDAYEISGKRLQNPSEMLYVKHVEKSVYIRERFHRVVEISDGFLIEVVRTLDNKGLTSDAISLAIDGQRVCFSVPQWTVVKTAVEKLMNEMKV